jgi:simple sugar transport system ATP-binding protein
MIGHSLPHAERERRVVKAKPALFVDDLSYRPRDPFGVPLERITLSVVPGEIVGIAGISGNGQSELMRLLSGETRVSSGESRRILLNDMPIGALGPRERRRHGITFVPEDRQGRGTVASLSLARNTLLTASDTGLARNGFIRFERLNIAASEIIAGYDVRCGGPSAPARSLSGGNLQKFIIGREVELRPKLLLVAQPTWGLDVGAAAFVRQKLLDIAASGVAVLVVSDELDELLEISDRLHVMFRGSLSPAIATRQATREAVGLAMAGSFEALTPRLETREAAHA